MTQAFAAPTTGEVDATGKDLDAIVRSAEQQIAAFLSPRPFKIVSVEAAPFLASDAALPLLWRAAVRFTTAD